jgi:hypothetical protein
VVLVNLAGETAQGLRLRIPNQTTVQDGASYFEIGQLVPTIVKVFPEDYSWGRSVAREANVEMLEARDGTKRSRVRGPSRRKVKVGWADGLDTTQVNLASPDPDYIVTSTTAGSEGQGAPAETPYLLDAIHEMEDGEHGTVLYIPSFDKSTGAGTDVISLSRPDRFIYGRIQGSLRVESIQGEEIGDEVVRVAQVTIEEEV